MLVQIGNLTRNGQGHHWKWLWPWC